MRRRLIYPHRSIRSVPITSWLLLSILLAAGLLSSLVYYFAAGLLSLHGSLEGLLLWLAGVPAPGWERIGILQGIEPVTVPVTPALRYGEDLSTPFLVSVATALVFVLIYRRVSLGRSFIMFLTAILLITGVALLIEPDLQYSSLEFTQIWLDTEMLVWLLLPWLNALFYIPILPSALTAIGWMLLVQAFAFVWSALRLAFCLGVLHYTGSLYLPALWFALGILADVLYLVFFFSMVVHQACSRWGERVSWQF